MNVAEKIVLDEPEQNTVIWRVFAILTRYPYGLTIHELVAKLYEGRADGGPEYANDAARASIWRFNLCAEKIGLGLRIRSNSHHGGAGWRFQIWVVR